MGRRPRSTRGATPEMYRTNQGPPPSARERCAEHDLAVGPGGACVLCRRERARPARSTRWLGPALLAAGLGTLLLGGVALARPRAQVPHVAEHPIAEAAPPVQAPPEVRPVVAAALPSSFFPREEPIAPRPAASATPAPPPHDYLEEAYAAMPKGNLYDEAAPAPATTPAACPCRATGCQPRYGYGIVRRLPSHRVQAMAVARVQSPPVAVASPPAMVGRAGGSFSRGAAVRR